MTSPTPNPREALIEALGRWFSGDNFLGYIADALIAELAARGFEIRAVDHCHADRDGDCTWEHCPQLRDGEPARSGRSCPKWNPRDDEDE